jgi:hypothetical protein
VTPDQILDNRMLKKKLGLRERKKQESGRNYTVWSVVT